MAGNLLTSWAVIAFSDSQKKSSHFKEPKVRILLKTPRRFSPAWAKLFKSFRRICLSLKPCVTLRNTLIILRRGVISPSCNPRGRGQPLHGVSRLLFLYIRNYPPYLVAVFSIRKLRMHHVVVTWANLSWHNSGLVNDINKALPVPKS